MHPEIEKLIKLAVADGEITEKERAVIMRKAEKLGEESEVARKWGVSRQAVNKIYNNATEKLKKRLYKYAYSCTG